MVEETHKAQVPRDHESHTQRCVCLALARLFSSEVSKPWSTGQMSILPVFVNTYFLLLLVHYISS